MFVDGKLVPNTEFGQMEIRGRAAERRSAAAARIRRGLSWKAWTQDLDEHLDRIDKLMWPTLMILGGGVSKHGDRFIPRLTVRAPVVAAQLRNDAGIIGAAIVAAEPPPGTVDDGGSRAADRRAAPGQARSRSSRRISAEPDTMRLSPAARIRSAAGFGS